MKAEQAEKKAEPKESFFSKMNSRKEQMNKDIEEKYPKLATRITYFKEVWAETFPDHKAELKAKMERRKQLAKEHREMEEKRKELTPEELEEIEKSIPEWKKGALVVSEEAAEEERRGLLGRFSDNVKHRFGQTEAGKKFYESEDYEKMKEVRANYQEFRNNLREGVENTQNPAVQRAVAAADIAYTESSCARAIKAMQAYDPYF